MILFTRTVIFKIYMYIITRNSNLYITKPYYTSTNSYEYGKVSYYNKIYIKCSLTICININFFYSRSNKI